MESASNKSMNPPNAEAQVRPNAAGTSQDAVTDPQMKHFITRLKQATTQEERIEIFHELKKTPHLFNAFLKMRCNHEERMAQQTPQHNAGQQLQNQPPKQEYDHAVDAEGSDCFHRSKKSSKRPSRTFYWDFAASSSPCRN